MIRTILLRLATIIATAAIAAGIILVALWGLDSAKASALMANLLAVNTSPTLVSYQGVVEVDGTPVNDTGEFIFKLYDVESGGTELWTETQSGLTVTDGLFQTNLGLSTPLTAALFDGSERWLEVTYGGTALLPRQRITSVPYALRANVADSATSVVVNGINPVDCNGSTDGGTIRLENGELQMCDGTDWHRISTSAVKDSIVLYSGPMTDGNLFGRSGADAACATAGARPAVFSSARAFLSVDGGDSIAGLPALYDVPTDVPIKSVNGTTIADNWADLLDGTIDASLASAGVIPNGSLWWSGSRPAGHTLPASSTCDGWSSGSGYGMAADSISTNSNWITLTSPPPECSQKPWLLCIAY